MYPQEVESGEQRRRLWPRSTFGMRRGVAGLSPAEVSENVLARQLMPEAMVVADVLLDGSDQFVFVRSLEAESAPGTRGSEGLVARHTNRRYLTLAKR
jgi:hypothetical protein